MADRERKKCFVISPIGGSDSETRIAADFFLEDIVKAALGADFEVARADDYSKAGNITSQVIQAIANADLIVADLSGRNANVYYELGVAHSYKKHVVPMISVDEPLPIPFDNYTERTIPYSLRTVHTRSKARADLEAAVRATVGEAVSNPVTTALGLAKAAASGDNPAQLIGVLADRLIALTERMDRQDRQLRAIIRVVEPGTNALREAILGQMIAERSNKVRNALAHGRGGDFLTDQFTREVLLNDPPGGDAASSPVEDPDETPRTTPPRPERK